MYNLIYLDNGAYTGSEQEGKNFYLRLDSVFNPYQFGVQQVMTSVESLQIDIDAERETKTLDSLKLLGMIQHRNSEEVSVRPISLNAKANSKRLVLKSIASQYDPLNLLGPCQNRARLFIYRLKSDGNLSWDEKFSRDRTKKWSNIVKQANRTNPPSIKRNIGCRNDPYEIVAFSGASKQIYCVVCYLKKKHTNG